MANVLRTIGVIGALVGLVLLAMGLMPLLGGTPFTPLGPFLVTQAVVAISGGVVAFGLGQLVAVNHRAADTLDEIFEHIKSQDEEGVPTVGSPRDVFANVPDYSPRRDPPIVKEGSYRDHTVLTLEDGTVAVQTTSGWKRFRRIRDFDRLLTA